MPLNTLYATPRKSTFIAFIGRAQNHVDLRALKKFKFLCNERLFSVCFRVGLLQYKSGQIYLNLRDFCALPINAINVDLRGDAYKVLRGLAAGACYPLMSQSQLASLLL